MRRAMPSLVLVGLLGLAASSFAQCDRYATAKMEKSCCTAAAKLGRACSSCSRGSLGAIATRVLGNFNISAARHPEGTLIYVTSKSGRPSSDFVMATLNDEEVALRPFGPGRYLLEGPAAGQLKVSVKNLWSSETVRFGLVGKRGGNDCAKGGAAGKCHHAGSAKDAAKMHAGGCEK